MSGAPLISLAGAATHTVSFELHICFPRKQTSNPLGFRNSTLGDVTLELVMRLLMKLWEILFSIKFGQEQHTEHEGYIAHIDSSIDSPSLFFATTK